MRVPFIALAGAVALAVAACSPSSTNDGGGPTSAGGDATTAQASTPPPAADTTTAVTVAPDPTTAPSAAANDTTAPTAPAAGGVTIGADGLPIPAPCAAGTNNADPKHGIEADSVNIAMVAVDYATLAKIGFAPSGRDTGEFLQPFIDKINADGGVCGRKINLQRVLFDVIAGKGGEACIKVTEDTRNLLVLGQGGFNELQCIADADTLSIAQSDWTKADVDGFGGKVFIDGVSLDEQYGQTIRYGLDNGWFDGKKVGIWYGSIFKQQGDAVESIVVPMLEDAGIEFKAFRTDFSGPTDPEGAVAIKTAATEFASMGVDVVVNFTAVTNHSGMQSELSAQGVKPQYITAPVNGNTTIELFAKAFNTMEIADGEIFSTTGHPLVDINADDPDAKACNEIYTAATGETIEPATFEYASVHNMCVQAAIVAAALSLAGPELSPQAMADALVALPPITVARQLGPVDWTADTRFSFRQMGIANYNGKDNKLTFDGVLIN